jgi:hypothetical protein
MKNFGSTSGLTILAEDQETPANGMVSYVTSSWNSGYQNGDIKGAFLSDTDDTDLVGGTDNDRSVNDNSLTVNGTITRSPVATGADLVAYSGFSSSNYLEQPYNPDLDFGTGDFCIMGWVNKNASGGLTYIMDRAGAANDGRFFLYAASDEKLVFRGYNSAGAAIATISTVGSLPETIWGQFVITRRSGTLEIYLNGALDTTASLSGDIDNTAADANLIVGAREDLSNVLQGSLALLRLSATAPTAEQIAKIYNDEKVLFQENAQATLYGSSDAVTALAHDPDTDLLHVGTSAGRSVFSGLSRINNTTTGVTTAISAANGVIGEQ